MTDTPCMEQQVTRPLADLRLLQGCRTLANEC